MASTEIPKSIPLQTLTIHLNSSTNTSYQFNREFVHGSKTITFITSMMTSSRHCPCLLLLLALSTAGGNPITKNQFAQVIQLLESKVRDAYPSDDKAQFADLLIQTKYDKKNLTYYHVGDPKLPVFISFGTGSVLKPIHVLLRGEDYLSPLDFHSFVVLRQTGEQSKYTVHVAYVVDMNNIPTSKVIWHDSMIEQKRKLANLLQLLGNYEVQARSLRAGRPRCDWMGFLLLCDSKKNLDPLRPRKAREPLEAEQEEPQNDALDEVLGVEKPGPRPGPPAPSPSRPTSNNEVIGKPGGGPTAPSGPSSPSASTKPDTAHSESFEHTFLVMKEGSAESGAKGQTAKVPKGVNVRDARSMTAKALEEDQKKDKKKKKRKATKSKRKTESEK